MAAALSLLPDRDGCLASELAENIADEFWRRRHEFKVELTPLQDAVQQAISAPKGPVILADGADAPSGGAPGDSPAILQALLKAGANVKTLINIVDPEAVDLAIRAGIDNVITLNVGAWSSDLWEAVQISGRVIRVSDGTFRFTGPGYRGREFHRGRTVVLQSGNIFLQIMERPVFQGDTALYTSLGMEPRDAHIVVVKTPSAFRVDYEPFAAEIILVDAPGPTSSNLMSFPWRKAVTAPAIHLTTSPIGGQHLAELEVISFERWPVRDPQSCPPSRDIVADQAAHSIARGSRPRQRPDWPSIHRRMTHRFRRRSWHNYAPDREQFADHKRSPNANITRSARIKPPVISRFCNIRPVFTRKPRKTLHDNSSAPCAIMKVSGTIAHSI